MATGGVTLTRSIVGNISSMSNSIQGTIRSPDEIEVYIGDYDVTPTMEEIVLATNKKLMTDDVTVHKIPVYETTNPTGGTTVYIAMEVE